MTEKYEEMSDTLFTSKTKLEKDGEKDELELHEFHQNIMDLYSEAVKVWDGPRADYESGVRFSLLGEQWTESEKSKRSATGRTVVTNNKLAANIRYVVNNFKSNPPSIKIHPQGSNANKNTAEILDGIIKYVQYKSDASEAYSHALQSILAGGMGAWRIIPREDCNGKIYPEIEKISDVLSVVIDPNAKKSNFSDMRYCFIINRISRDQFEQEFPEQKEKESTVNEDAMWGGKDFVQVGEFWRKVDNKVEQYLFNGSDILYSNTEYPGKHIPLIFVVGEDISIGSDRKLKSLISDVIDQQKILNYTKSEIVDSIQKTTKTKLLVDISSISTPELQRMWNSSNSDAFPYLPWDGKGGAKEPRPIEPGTIPSAYLEGSKEASEDIQFGMGIPNPMTNVPTSQSGKAISLQLSQQNLQTYNFINNINIGIKYSGEILLDMIQHYYDEEDIMNILGIDGQITQVPVNTQYEENGKSVYHDLTKSAEYTCMVSIGPSYSDKRSEMVDVLSTLSQQMPIIGQTAADLIIQNMDIDNADSIARRIRAGMNPQIVAATNPTNDDTSEKEQSAKAQIEQMQQVIQQLQQQLKSATDANQLKIQLDQMKYQHETEMEVMKTKFKRETEVQQMMIDEKKAEHQTLLDNEKEKVKTAHEIATKHHDFALNTHLQDQKHQQTLELTLSKTSR